ncbi:ABC transporter ATP-binding protein [Microbacterium sp. SORGH_AS_0888]|uniref:ABC transporter ATP-binding protein n=1 Tax=Microbacterium sp. SORGH_AS_0888 TaxID=3041791 RepID=UPI002783D9F9|nr:ATP-binding cassette domain-containing protein [Microbacterium sp. SORGH_AS_0888]MDQ1128949.1 iron complex transport system ATP-binding protein [Microbacterium sp. SORGH_AS_0888]
MSADPVVVLEDVTFRRGDRNILDRVSLRILPGEHWVLIGPNGAGKSTILRFVGAQTFPTSGTVDLLGQRIGRVELLALRRRIGHVNPRHPLDSPLTITEVVLTGITGTTELMMRWEPDEVARCRAAELIELLGLGDKAECTWPTLSQGERGRALIARALMGEPALLLLDEPSTGLDVAAREQLLETFDHLAASRPDLASVLVTHHLEEIPEAASHALLLAHGSVVAAGPVADTLTTELVSRAFEHPIVVDRSDGRWRARSLRSAR